MDWSLPSIELINLQCILAIITVYKEHFVFFAMAIVVGFLFLLWCSGCCCRWCSKCTCKSLLWTSVLLTLQLIYALGSFYTHYDLVDIVKEREALYCVIAFVHILSVMPAFGHPNVHTPASSHLVVYMFGTVGVVLVNAVALLVELILKARNGQRTVDLRVILLPTESVFAVCCLALQISACLKKNRKRIRKDINRLRRLCVCKQTQRNSPPHNHENALELLPPVPQPSGS